MNTKPNKNDNKKYNIYMGHSGYNRKTDACVENDNNL